MGTVEPRLIDSKVLRRKVAQMLNRAWRRPSPRTSDNLAEIEILKRVITLIDKQKVVKAND